MADKERIVNSVTLYAHDEIMKHESKCELVPFGEAFSPEMMTTVFRGFIPLKDEWHLSGDEKQTWYPIDSELYRKMKDDNRGNEIEYSKAANCYGTLSAIKFKTYNEVKDSKNGFSAILNKGWIALDADNDESSLVMWRLFKRHVINPIIIKTKRGYHFIFRDDRANFDNLGNSMNVYCWINTNFDYIGNNKPHWEILKHKGYERYVLNMPSLDEISYLPEFLRPWKYNKNPVSDMKFGCTVKGETNLEYDFIPNINTPDGWRYNFLLRYAGKLSYYFNGKEEDLDANCAKVKSIIDAMNMCMIKPRADGANDTITNPENLKKMMRESRNQRKKEVVKSEFMVGKKFLHEVCAHKIAEKEGNNIVLINGVIHIRKNDDLYSCDRDEVLKLVSKYQDGLTKSQKMECINSMTQTHDIKLSDKNLSPAHLIPFKSKVYNILENKFYDYSPEHIFTHKIPFDLDLNAKPTEKVDKWLNSLSFYDSDRRKSIEEAIGYPLYRSNKLMRGKMILFNGDALGGKSTVQDIIRFILSGSLEKGDKSDVISDLKLTQIDDRFAKIQLMHKWANIGDDIGSGALLRNETLKSVISGDTIEGEYKGMDMVSFRPYCKLIFSCNQVPTIADEGGAMSARIHVINFKNCYLAEDALEREKHPNAEKINTNLIYELTEDEANVQYILRLAIEGLRRLIEHETFTIPEEEKKEMNDIRMNNNPLEMWLDDYAGSDLTEQKLFCTTMNKTDLKINFDLWCSQNGYTRISSIYTIKKFSQELSKKFNFTTINRRSTSITNNRAFYEKWFVSA